MKSNDIEPHSIDECQRRTDWSKCKEVIQVELYSLNKRKVFGPVVLTSSNVKLVRYKWVFVRKRIEKNGIVRYKTCLIAQVFFQCPGIDYEDMYSPIIDVVTFHYLISLVGFGKLNMQLMNVVTSNLYETLDIEIYIKVPEKFKLTDSNSSRPRNTLSVPLRHSLYGLK